jgi:hypothetical protein
MWLEIGLFLLRQTWGFVETGRGKFSGFVGVLLGLQGLYGFILWVHLRFLGVLLVSLGLFWVHLGALSYIFCIIGWRPL